MNDVIDNKSINKLYGIIFGINADEIINEQEITYLKEWLNNNRNYKHSEIFNEIYTQVDDILKNNVITNEEKEKLLDLCKYIKKNYYSSKNAFTDLLGIIEGISCDKKINTDELKSLKSWLDNNQFLNNNLIFKKVNSIVEKILEDQIISNEEEKEILNLFDTIIITKKEAIYINYLRILIDKKKNIGNFLVSLYDNKQLINKIHLYAKTELLKALNKSYPIHLLNTELIFLSVCFIALDNYDGNFYDYISNEYYELYEKFTRQRVDGLIRSIISMYYRDENATRQINYVLENTIVPKKFLANYYDFVFDIYKVNFQFMINQDSLDEDLEFVFNGLKEVFNDDKDEVNIAVTNKTYKLIKSTKDLIYNSDSVSSLVEFTKHIINSIDSYYWSNDENFSSSYFKEGFDSWIEKNNNEILTDQKNNNKVDKEKLKSRWQPNFILQNNEIYLHVPEHKIKNDYDFNDIKILIYDNGKVIKEITNFKTFEIIGGYRLEVPNILIENPLSKIEYKIIANKDVIYDSKEILNNKFIIFNDKGNSIAPNKYYEGNIFVAYKNNIDGNIEKFYSSKKYNLGSAYVNKDTILLIEDEYVTFTSEIKSGIIGDTYEDTFIKIDNQYMIIYKNVYQIIFETTTDINEIGIKINSKRYRINELNFINKEENGKNILFINYPINVSGKYEIEFFNVTTGKILKEGKYKFYLDTKLDFDVNKMGKNNYSIRLTSSLLEEENVEYLLNLNNYNDFKISLSNDEQLILPLNIPIYKLDNGQWKSIEDYIWIDDININSIIYIRGIKLNEIIIASSNNVTELIRLKAYKDDLGYKIPIGTLRSYIGTTDKIILVLSENQNLAQNYIECYMKCKFDDITSYFTYNPETKELNVKISLFGSGRFKFELDSKNGNTLLAKEFDSNHTKFKIKNLKDERTYFLRVYKLATGFSLEGDELLLEKQVKYYSYEGLLNKNLKVKSVNFDFFDSYQKDLIRKKFYLHRTYFEVLKYLGNKKYIANVYRWDGYKNYLENINPVEIEITSEIEDNNLEIAAIKDGDGLLIDFDNKSILDSMEDRNAPDIYSCNVIIPETE